MDYRVAFKGEKRKAFHILLWTISLNILKLCFSVFFCVETWYNRHTALYSALDVAGLLKIFFPLIILFLSHPRK